MVRGCYQNMVNAPFMHPSGDRQNEPEAAISWCAIPIDLNPQQAVDQPNNPSVVRAEGLREPGGNGTVDRAGIAPPLYISLRLQAGYAYPPGWLSLLYHMCHGKRVYTGYSRSAKQRRGQGPMIQWTCIHPRLQSSHPDKVTWKLYNL